MPIELSDGQPDPPHHSEQFLARADAGAAVAEIAGGALEHGRVPARSAQQMRREQPADRAADHQGAWSGQRSLPHAVVR